MAIAKLPHTYGFSEHAVGIMTKYFEIPKDLAYLGEIDDQATARQYVRQLLLPVEPVSGQLASQTYLRTLFELPGPVIEARRAMSRISSSKPRPRTERASTALVAAARDLAFEAYHFKERIKEHATCLKQVHRRQTEATHHAKKVVRLLRQYEQKNDRVLRHRNFIVHGPRNRHDEFSDLKLVELAAIALHDDLWFEQLNVFNEYRLDWLSLSKTLLTSMETAIAIIQVENENSVVRGEYVFTPKS